MALNGGNHTSEDAGTAPTNSAPVLPNDDAPTVCAISSLAAILANVLHEGLGHAATALLTGATSGVLTTVAWSSNVDSRLVAAGGTLANLAAGALFWIALCYAKRVSVHLRFFLLVSVAFNLFIGTGYFLFSGFTDFGDWARVIAGLPAHWFWRTLLVVVGFVSYYAAALLVGIGLVRYVGVPRSEFRRLRKLTVLPYLSALVLVTAGGLLNPIGMQLMWQSALPAAAGGHSGLLWLRYAIAQKAAPLRSTEAMGRSYMWIGVAVVLSLIFVFVLGRGITLHR